jgi:hypothetical protein
MWLRILPSDNYDLRLEAIWITDPHRGQGQRFIVRADEKLTAFSTTKVP